MHGASQKKDTLAFWSYTLVTKLNTTEQRSVCSWSVTLVVLAPTYMHRSKYEIRRGGEMMADGDSYDAYPTDPNRYCILQLQRGGGHFRVYDVCV